MSIKELKILDRVFQNYLEYNDNDEEARGLYLEMLSPLEYDIVPVSYTHLTLPTIRLV